MTTTHRKALRLHPLFPALALAMAMLLGACNRSYFSDEGKVAGPVAPGDSVILLAAGDVATCKLDGDERTAAMLDTIPGLILAPGDLAYYDGTDEDFENCYHPSWGRHRDRTYPVPGNHEYHTRNAAGYFDYFEERAGPAGRGYYSFDLGAWHIVALNTNLPMHPGSEQEQWLRADLAAHTRRCTLAFMHHPRFSSGFHANTPAVGPLWTALYEGGADVVIGGHDHHYERFARMAPNGRLDPERGIRSFVVGTGGAELRPFIRRAPGSQTRFNGDWGLLKLTLRSDRYEWAFVTVSGQTLDHSEEACR